MSARNIKYDEFIMVGEGEGGGVPQDVAEAAFQDDPASGRNTAESGGTGPRPAEDAHTATDDGTPAAESRTSDRGDADDAPRLGEAVWKNGDADQPVRVTEQFRDTDGVDYVRVEGSDTALPLADIEFPTDQPQAAEGPGQIPEGASRESTQAKEVAERLVAKKVAELKASGRVVTSQERALLYADYYRNGFPDATYSRFGGHIPVQKDGEEAMKVATDDGEVTVLTIDGQQKTAAGDTEYTCTVEGQSKPIPLKGSDISNAYMAQHADAIAGSFTDEQQALMQWYAEGRKGPAPVTREQLAKIEDADNPQTILNEAISGQMKYLDGKLTTLQAELKSLAEAGRQNSEDYRAAQEALAQIQDKSARLERTMNIPKEGLLSINAKIAALTDVQQYARGNGDLLLVSQAQNAMDRQEVKDGLEQQQRAFTEYLKAQGISGELLQLAQDPSKFDELTKHGQFKELPDIMMKAFGVQDEAAAQQLLNDYIENSFSPEDPRRGPFLEYAKRGGWWTLVALVAAGLGAAVLAGGAVSSMSRR
ncbi:MAG TPA: hypothetical protein VND99_00840 [Candidatus Acidoferrales bacterium]|nr:hypothetical protein [Candidatus Acidoferrales bacterium]